MILQGACRIRIISVEFPANTRIRRRRILHNLSSVSAVSSALLPPRSITPPPRRAFNRITARRSTSPPRRRAKEIVLPSDRFCSAVNAYYCDIVMNTFVCLSVCLSGTISPESHARSLPNFVHVACGRGSVLLRQDDEIPRERGQFWGFPPH